jgi:hypothetical protein
LAAFIRFSAFARRLNSGGAHLFHILYGEILDSLAVIIIALVMAAVFGRGPRADLSSSSHDIAIMGLVFTKLARHTESRSDRFCPRMIAVKRGSGY